MLILRKGQKTYKEQFHRTVLPSGVLVHGTFMGPQKNPAVATAVATLCIFFLHQTDVFVVTLCRVLCSVVLCCRELLLMIEHSRLTIVFHPPHCVPRRVEANSDNIQ